MMEDPRTIGLGTHLMFVAKNLERIGDHATNIAESVHYLVNGTNIRDTRPKGAFPTLPSSGEGSREKNGGEAET
jgi:phosphate transport system protein